jgi:23S rRNA (guanine745-N1)-methyltransferase
MRLLCTVRNCQQPLERDERLVSCTRGHTFDVARSGYVNLLQPQDKKSSDPGDSAEVVGARRRLLDRGTAEVHVAAMAELLAGDATSLLDVGCGDGWFTDRLRKALNVEAEGVDISIPAIDRAAKSFPDCQWVVANADRWLPYESASFDIVTSITSRMNGAEFRRVLQPEGRLLVALTAADDLVELREIIGGERQERDRVERTVHMFEAWFELLRRERAATTVTLDRAAIDDLLLSTYRGARTKERERLGQLESLEVTLSRDLLLFG